MAKKQKTGLITASFHFLVKELPNPDDRNSPIEAPFSEAEFDRIVKRISDNAPLNERDPEVIQAIKAGKDLPFSGYERPEEWLHFGNFDAAYYGQQYRNNMLGIISADSLNLRPFNYLITRLGDGKILVGVTYNGQFGDYDGIKKCLTHILGGNYKVGSRTIKVTADEIGNGVPVELNLHYKKTNDRPEHRGVFDSVGVIAITRSEYGADFDQQIANIAGRVRGGVRERKKILADIIGEGSLLALDDEEIVGCTAIIRDGRRKRTIYLLGENNFATKFSLNVQVNADGIPNRVHVRDEMIRVMRERVMPLMR